MAQTRGSGKPELPIGQARGRQGGRWYNERPDAEEIAAWFKDNVTLHEGLDHKKYVGGLTLISQTEYAQEVIEQNGRTTIKKIKNLVYTPYSKVESRIQYFWDLMLFNPEWEGSIEPVDVPGKSAAQDGDLPPGFYRKSMKLNGEAYHYIACSMRVRIVQRNSQLHNGIILPPPATKMIPVLTENYGTVEVDPYVLMKAETGAVGRALGMAGMLVIPGAGVATAEDMLEAQAQGGVPEGEVESISVPIAVEESVDEKVIADGAEVLAKEVEKKLDELKAQNPDAHQQFQTWAKSRGFGAWPSLTEAQLRGIVKKLDKTLVAE